MAKKIASIRKSYKHTKKALEKLPHDAEKEIAKIKKIMPDLPGSENATKGMYDLAQNLASIDLDSFFNVIMDYFENIALNVEGMSAAIKTLSKQNVILNEKLRLINNDNNNMDFLLKSCNTAIGNLTIKIDNMVK